MSEAVHESPSHPASQSQHLHAVDAPVHAPAAAPARPEARKKLFTLLALTVVAGAVGVFAYEHFIASHYVSTDNAYTAAETAQVTPFVGGIVREVRVADTQAVKRGDVLVVLDETDARLALEQAEAELGRAQRRVRGYVANDASLAAQIVARDADRVRAEAQLASAAADLERARVDLQRREALADTGSVSADEITRARNAFQTASAALAAAKAASAQSTANRVAAAGQREANATLIAGVDEEANPEVALARARRDQARVNLERMVVRAPVDGVVARRAVQLGQQVAAGSPLLSIVPTGQVHVDANFKEGQLDKVRIGQPVEIESDLYGSRVVYHGTVQGLSGGTGSAFAAIPAQNATGNWIKVVQRVPVRIALDPRELAERPLQVGLSMTATVDTRAQ
ncbi:HlyD family efflux transporter periplasmic adaptor subunit [Roseateles chitinivorans]|uniref:HlyD family secretion protein n=1 Tax=Roseateles chitinivorans TaxID=2917965 RepID=UPI003D678FF0